VLPTTTDVFAGAARRRKKEERERERGREREGERERGREEVLAEARRGFDDGGTRSLPWLAAMWTCEVFMWNRVDLLALPIFPMTKSHKLS